MKRSAYIAALVLICLFKLGLATDVPTALAQVRSYYLTPQSYSATAAPYVCARGYHFASIFELIDNSALQYNAHFAENYKYPTTDLGQGPPAYTAGFMRTGYANTGGFNCDGWTNSTTSASTYVYQLQYPPSYLYVGSVWGAYGTLCTGKYPVWCVSD